MDSVIWAQAQGEIEASGDLPRTTFTPPPGQFPVKLVVAEVDNALFLAAGARGAAAIYTEHFALHSPHSKGADQDVVVSRLHHHQAPHQSPLRDGTMTRPRSTGQAPACGQSAALVAIGLAATLGGCALKNPPDAAAIKEQALPGAAAASAVDRRRGRAPGAVGQLARQLPRRRSWRPRSPRRSRTTPICASAPRGSSRRSSTRNWRGRSSIRPSISSRAAAASCPGRLGPPGRRPHRDLGARPLGPGSLRPRGERRASRVGAGRFRIRAAVDRGARGQELVPRHRGRAAGRSGAARRFAASEELVRLAEDRLRIGVGESGGSVRRARQRRDLS